MDCDIIFPGNDFEQLRAALLRGNDESCAILLANPVCSPNGKWRLLIRETHITPDDAYEIRNPVYARLKPEFLMPLEYRARIEGLSVIYCHSHPSQELPEFSPIDDKAEASWKDYLDVRLPGRPHIAIVFGQEALDARIVGSALKARVVEIDKSLTFHDLHHREHHPLECYDRQVRAFGVEGQQKIQELTVGIVGAGGTGSIVIEQLAHLGVQRYILMDMDTIEETNLNRLVGAGWDDIGQPKVKIGERQILRIVPHATVSTLQQDILNKDIWRALLDADIVFGCIDAHGPRSLLNRMAYQYFIPVIDMGTGLSKGAEETLEIAGRVNYVAPGMPCLWCCQELSSIKVRRDFLNERERAEDPYFVDGKGEPQPAVISVNGVVSSLAVTMFLSIVAGIPSPPRILNYLGHHGRVKEFAPSINPTCPFCSRDEGFWGLGDKAPTPYRAIS